MRYVLTALLLTASPVFAYDELVEKQEFTLTDFRTQGGETVPEMRLGYETYGTLNEAKDNAILIPHFFSGNSHAAGKYTAEDAAPGYWDSIIGPGLPIDTDKWFVVSVDTPVNLAAKDPNVITTGPASINPATGKPWGTDFPVMTIGDFVETQKGLMDQLGIPKWHAVMGASMGGLQSYEWAARYPDLLDRVVPVIASGWSDADLIAWLDVWAAPIRIDPNWNGGDYYDGPSPDAGLAAALEVVTLHANSAEWANSSFGRNLAEGVDDPAASLDARFAVQEALDNAGAARAAVSDANHFLYLVKASQLFVAGQGQGDLYDGLKAIDVPVMIIQSEADLVFPGNAVRDTASIIKSDGTPVEVVQIGGGRGHLDGVINIAQAGDRLRAFLEAESVADDASAPAAGDAAESDTAEAEAAAAAATEAAAAAEAAAIEATTEAAPAEAEAPEAAPETEAEATE